MSFHFPAADFNSALEQIVTTKDVMYGSGPSPFHIAVPDEHTALDVFGSADAEDRFNALLAVASDEVVNLRLEHTPRNVFTMFASMVLQEYAYNLDVSRWLAIANAVIVGVAEYTEKYGHEPVSKALFVYDYMHDAEFALSNEY